MSSTSPHAIPHAIIGAPREAGVLELQGEDAENFLQAQFASDIRRLQPGRWQWSAWLDAQGRVRALLQLARLEATHFAALVRGGDAHALGTMLSRFVLRARVRIETRTFLLHAGRGLESGQTDAAQDGLGFGMGTHTWWVRTSDTDTGGGDALRDQAWGQDLRDGLPWLPHAALDALSAQALGLERLGAVSFDKGCYPGQEIVARLHFRGGNKRHLVGLAGEPSTLSMLIRQYPESFQALTAHMPSDGPTSVLGVLGTATEAGARFEPFITVRHGD